MTDELTRPDQASRKLAEDRHEQLTKPVGSLGRLEELSIWAAGVQGTCPPRQFSDVRVLMLAADHGIARAGVSAYPPEVTAQMVLNILAGGGALNAIARQTGASVKIFDIAVDSALVERFPAEIGAYKVRAGSGSIDIEDALSTEDFDAAMLAGRSIADAEIDSGADLLVIADMGIGNTTPAAAIMAALIYVEPIEVVGRGSGIDDFTWMRKVEAVRDALRRAAHLGGSPMDLLRVAGGADYVVATSLMLQAARRRTPVLLDGVMSCVCALAAARIEPGICEWMIAGHRSPEPAQSRALSELGLIPLLDIGVSLDEGAGALLALPLLQSAIAALAEMATFAEAGVSTRAP